MIHNSDTSQHLKYKMISNNCDYPLRPIQDLPIFNDLPPCHYRFMAYNQDNDSAAVRIKVGLQIEAKFVVRCSLEMGIHFFHLNIFNIRQNSTGERITGMGNPPYIIKAVEYGKVTNEFHFSSMDSIVSVEHYFDPFSGSYFTIEDACGDRDSTFQKGEHEDPQLTLSKSCDGAYFFSSTLNKYNATRPITELSYRWYLNNVFVSDSFVLRLNTFSSNDKVHLELKSAECMLIADKIVSVDTSATSIDLRLYAEKTILCNKDSVQIQAVNANGGLNQIQWNTGSASASIWVNSSGTYTAIAQNQSGCFDTSSVTIDHKEFSIQSMVTNNSCYGQSLGKIVITAHGGHPPYSYKWNDNTRSKDRDSLANGEYTVEVSDSLGCSSKSVYNIESPEPLTMSIASITPSCKSLRNGRVTTRITGGTPPYQYLWGNGTTAADADSLAPGVHLLAITDKNLCIVEYPISILSQDTEHTIHYDTICANDSIRIGNNFYNQQGIYHDTIKSDQHCDKILTSHLWVISPIILSVTANQPSCHDIADGSLDLAVTDVTPDLKFYLNNKEINLSQLKNLAAGDFVIKVQNGWGCVEERKLTLINPALLTLDIGEDRKVNYGDSLSIQVSTNISPPNIRVIRWTSDPEQMHCPTCTLEYKYLIEQDHVLKVYIESNTGCIAEREINIKVDGAFKLFVPNVFRPADAAQSKNQFLAIYSGKGIARIEYFRIFNRLGSQVFEATNINPNEFSEGWDGLIKGQGAPQDVYVYIAQVLGSDGTKKIIYGDFMLVR